MKVAEFDFHLPHELIAQKPIARRDHSRLMVLDRQKGEIHHQRFYQIIDLLSAGDILVVNDSRVIPARLHGVRQDTKGRVEILLLRPLSDRTWEVLVKPAKKAKVGTTLQFGEILQAKVLSTTDVGGRVLEFSFDGDFEQILDTLGEMPLPPYIQAELEDKERYQTVYSKESGSVAAPTAGLHFTPELLEKIQAKGIEIVPLTLHVGLGTFRPVQTEEVSEHEMHSEYYHLSQESAAKIRQCKKNGKRVVAVGTTAVRTLETIGSEQVVTAGDGWTDIFIYPGYQFKVVDAMITNFHLPKSSLIMLVSAFAGRDFVLTAYHEAIKERYRFYSFGDAMFIV